MQECKSAKVLSTAARFAPLHSCTPAPLHFCTFAADRTAEVKTLVMKTVAALLLLTIVAATGCIKRDQTGTGGTPTAPSNTLPVTFKRVTRGTRSAFIQQSAIVATSDRAFADILARITPDELIKAPNFAHEMAVAVFLGERLTGGFQLRVTNVTETDGVLTVEGVETIPNLRCAVTQSLTQPFDIISVPRQGGSVLLVVTREVGPPCF